MKVHVNNPKTSKNGRVGGLLLSRRFTRRQMIVGLGTTLALAHPAFALAAEKSNSNAAEAAGSTVADNDSSNEHVIDLSDDEVLVDGSSVPSDAQSDAAVYTAHDVVYYEDRDTYDSGNPYGEGDESERHTADDAEKVTVVHIAQPGIYRVRGSMSEGQIWIDLGEDADDDPDAKVTLVLDGADIACSVAPAVVFYRVYECCSGWDADTATSEVDTSDAGATVVIADDSDNTVTGSHIARIYKDQEGEQKKLWKIDGALYSFVSMNVEGESAGTGTLSIIADNEGLDSELHLTIEGGNINIQAQDDGINTNEDGVSVTTINGGTLHVIGGLGEEGDGIDSNGWLVINGGTVIAMANPRADSGLDADMGSYVNGGTVVALGSTMDWAESDSDQVTMNLQFTDEQDAGDAIVVCDSDDNIVFAYDPSEDETASGHTRSYRGAVLSCSNFEVGQTYSVYVGGTLEGSEVQGIYNTQDTISYEDGIQQSYTGTDVQGGPGFMGPGGFGGEPGGAPNDGPNAGQGGAPQQDGPVQQGRQGTPNESNESEAHSDASTEFYMQDKVNAFSGVGPA